MVFDPKSKMNSIEDLDPGIVKYISNSRELKAEGDNIAEQSLGPKMVLIHRSVADEILAGTGKHWLNCRMRLTKPWSLSLFD